MERLMHVRMIFCLLMAMITTRSVTAQKRWDGGASDGQWSSALNWLPDGVPVSGDDVLIDNLVVPGRFTVSLPTGTTTASLNSLRILPFAGDTIMLEIPSSNTASPAIDLASTGDALVLGPGAVMRNASGATSGETILMQGWFRIKNGGHYIHRTARANAYLIDHLSTDSSATHGLFEFDVPGNAGYTVSLTGNIFGDLLFSAVAGGGNKSYSGSGATDLTVRGHLQIGQGAQLTSTLTADIRVGGDLIVDGNISLQPVTTGTTGRSLLFTGIPSHVRGSGILKPGPFFRQFEAMAGATVILLRDVGLPLSSHAFLLHTDATLDMGTSILSGPGSFLSESGATLGIGDRNGLTTGDSGNLRTGVRQLDPGMTYVYGGAGIQHTGNALPARVTSLAIDKPSGDLALTRSIESGSLRLQRGLLKTTDSTLITIGVDGVSSPLDEYGRHDEGWSGGFVSGPCILRTPGIGTWRFPIGAGDHFAPAAIRRTQNGEVFYRAAYHQGTIPAIMDTSTIRVLDVNEYWTLSASGNSPLHDAFLDLSWRRNDWPGLDSAVAGTLRMAGLDSSAGGERWTSLGTTPTIEMIGAGGWVRSDQPITRFNAFTFGIGTAMSVLAFHGSLHCIAAPDGNVLTMQGSTPAGIEGRLESSVDGLHFKTLTALPGDGNSIKDEHPASGTVWYRWAFERAGEPTQHSNTCRVQRVEREQWKIFPQPASGDVQLNAPFKVHDARYRLMDFAGRVIGEGALSDGDRWTIGLPHGPSGTYLLQIFHDKGLFTTPLVLR